MVKEEQKSIIQMVWKPFILEIMESLSEQPRRFVDLSNVCKNDKDHSV